MAFTKNHDKNSWKGNQYSNFGEGLEASMVLACTVNGMPLVYSGQDAGLNRSLKFFEKDLIEWTPHPFAAIYTKLSDLKHKNQALWNGSYGGEMIRILNDKPDQVLSFSRTKNGYQEIPIINYRDKPVTVKLNSKYQKGTYTELFSNAEYISKGDDVINLKPWNYLVLVK